MCWSNTKIFTGTDTFFGFPNTDAASTFDTDIDTGIDHNFEINCKKI